MEIFLALVLLGIIGVMCFLLVKCRELKLKYDDLLEMQTDMNVLLKEHDDQIPNLYNKVYEDLERQLVDFRASLEPTKPIKPNNWDSMRQAFKGPTRVEIDERD